MTTLSNGWMYTVTFDGSMPSSVVELSTADKVVLTPKDYIIIDNHDPDSGGVDISAISRETIDIIDVVDDVFVKRSEYEKAKKDLSDYVDSKTNEVYSNTKNDNKTLSTELTDYIDTKINALDYAKVELTGSRVLSEISQTDGKISVKTRDLSIGELVNADSFVDNKINQLDVPNTVSSVKKQLITKLNQEDGKISYETTDLVISSIPNLQPQLTKLSAVDAQNASAILSVGTIVGGMNNALSSLYRDISACFYLDDNGLKRQKRIDEVDFDDTISVCFQLMKKLDDMFNPMGSINIYESYDEALPNMDRKFY